MIVPSWAQAAPVAQDLTTSLSETSARSPTGDDQHVLPEIQRFQRSALAWFNTPDCSVGPAAQASANHGLAQARSNVTVHPGLPWAEVPGWLAGAAVVLVPSVRETFGLVALEALSVGTPVVAYAVGNLPDLIGDAGTLVPPTAGPDGLRVAIIRLLTDPVTYRRASQAAWRRARDYHPEAIAHLWLEATRR